MALRHISEVDLLRYADGELSWLGRFGFERHLRSCWQCRTQLAATNETIGDFVRYREKLWAPSAPAVPAPWPDLHAAMRQRRLERALAAPPRWASLRLLAAGAAAAAALVGALAAVKFAGHREASAPIPVSRPAATRLPTADSGSTMPATQPARKPAIAPAPAPDHDAEVRIVAGLHRAGADLGEPIALRWAGTAWQVAAAGVAPQRLAEISQTLRDEAGVQILSEALPSNADLPARASASIVAPVDDPGLAARLGGRTRFERLANQVLAQSDAVMARVFALRNLERRFPAAVEAGLTAGSRAALTSIRQAHRAAFVIETKRLDEQAAPILAAFDMASPVAQAAGNDPFEAARRADEALNSLLAEAGGGTASPHDLAVQLASELAVLRAYREW